MSIPILALTTDEIALAKAFITAASHGELEVIQQLVESGQVDINMRRRRGDQTALHAAVLARKVPVVEYLVKRGANCNEINGKGKTPFWLGCAVALPQETLELMLDHGADILQSCARTGDLPLQGAREQTSNAGLCRWLQGLTDEALEAREASGAGAARPGFQRCPLCYFQYRVRGRCYYFYQDIAQDTHPYVQQYRHLKAADALVAKAGYHRLGNKAHLRKEISESLSIYNALTDLLQTRSITWSDLCVIDLCAGCSLTTVIIGEEHPETRVLAIDRMSEYLVPHFQDNMSYHRHDIMHDDFLSAMAAQCQGRKHCVVIGMHLCGTLSVRAIDLAVALPTCLGLILSPCCMPTKKSELNVTREQVFDNDTDRYAFWCRWLTARMTDAGFVEPRLWIDEQILSDRNALILGTRPAPVDAIPEANRSPSPPLQNEASCSAAAAPVAPE
ncbi:uncharacterized protein MONBRDRAFT_6796 [Monosiga brevicollis MX1]|uniref:Methyltransferase domain-containing protein n=1 Tax=Monosiga brevicollis TaxID=81824 RepID=A9UVC0_MONBE|nr:uncharacterized protein MONBRDRAFT_6796 [Monosiga brevicollis MX1]EDQ90867.1 predicted protein [Monosiga brevicollis MX1]|eukprot:XP_001744164.1 hypothetical protein [Monosiga brevicollis MX1]